MAGFNDFFKERRGNMMTFVKTVPILFVAILAGCSNQLDCGDKNAVDLITEITNDNQLLTAGWWSHSAMEGVKARDKVKEKYSNDLDSANNNVSSLYRRLEITSKECKSKLLTSGVFKSKLENLQQTDKNLSDIENLRPIEPKRFYWSANSTQKEHDVWRAAQDKYEAELSKQKMESKLLYENTLLLKTDIKRSEEFINLGCQYSIKSTTTLTPADLNNIESQMRYRVSNDLKDEVIHYVNSAYDKTLRELSSNKKIITDLNNMVDREAKKAESDAASAAMDKLKLAEYKLTNIVTKNVNDKTGAVACEGDISVNVGKEYTFSRRISYKLEKTSDNNLYGTIISAK